MDAESSSSWISVAKSIDWPLERDLMSNKKCFPGAGLRPAHYPHLSENPPEHIQWFEVISENFIDSFGRPRSLLRKFRQDFPIALHGVGLSVANASGLNLDYLRKLKQLVDEIEPMIVSDHLCWTGLPTHNIHDLLPIPYTQSVLETVVSNVQQIQDTLGRPMVIENVSTYLTYEQSEMSEWEFIGKVLKATGARLLLDINNVYVSAQNHGFDAHKYLEAISPDQVAQIHLAGYTDTGEFLFDTHSNPVFPPVWDLFTSYIAQAPNVPFMVEWDDDLPDFPTLDKEVAKAKSIWDGLHRESQS